MNDKQAAEIVMRWATQAYTDAVSRHAKANAEFQGNYTSEETWDSCNPDVGIGTNPYTHKIEQLRKIYDSTHKAQRDWYDIYDFVTRRICNLLEEKS